MISNRYHSVIKIARVYARDMRNLQGSKQHNEREIMNQELKLVAELLDTEISRISRRLESLDQGEILRADNPKDLLFINSSRKAYLEQMRVAKSAREKLGEGN